MTVIGWPPFPVPDVLPRIVIMAAVTPYALGRFRAHTDFGPRADDFTGVIVDDQVAPLAALLPSAPDLDALLADWPANLKLVGDAVEESRAGQRWADLVRPVSDFARLAPLRPGQIFQSGANYQTHVIQLMMASAAEQGDDDQEATRRRATALMAERAASGTPYVFIGLASAICGPDDNVVLPGIGTQHDWELELGVVIGTEAYRVEAGDALSHVAGYVMANDLTTRDRVFRPDMPGLGTDWLAGKNSPTFLPLGPWLVPAPVLPRPGRPAGHAQAQRPDHAGRDDRRHDLRRARADRPRLGDHAAAPRGPAPHRVAGRQRRPLRPLPAARRCHGGHHHRRRRRSGHPAQPVHRPMTDPAAAGAVPVIDVHAHLDVPAIAGLVEGQLG